MVRSECQLVAAWDGAIREGLAALVAKCDQGGDRPCPIIQVLGAD